LPTVCIEESEQFLSGFGIGTLSGSQESGKEKKQHGTNGHWEGMGGSSQEIKLRMMWFCV
jgi:hypothetical protein